MFILSYPILYFIVEPLVLQPQLARLSSFSFAPQNTLMKEKREGVGLVSFTVLALVALTNAYAIK
jgi:hypothetical protein